METITLTPAQHDNLVELISKRRKLAIALMIVGLIGLFPPVIHIFSGGTYAYSAPGLVFLIIGILYQTQADNAAKILKGDQPEIFQTKCLKTSWLGHVRVENNLQLSKEVKKPTKAIEYLGTIKATQVGDDIGILPIEKDFLAFPLNV